MCPSCQYPHVRRVPDGCTGSGMVPGTGIRVGTGGCYTGYYPATHRAGSDTSKASPDSEAGPVASLQGRRSGWSGCSVPSDPLVRARLLVPPFGPGRAPAGPSLYQDPPHGQRARFDPHFLKVSQNAEVSPESVNKACHSPYIQKRVPNVTSWISGISQIASLLSQGINGPI